MRYKVGDKVRVRQWDDMVNEFGINEYENIKINFPHFAKGMKDCCGKEFVITTANLKDKFYILDGSGWIFSDEMLEPVENKEMQIKDSGNRTTFATGAVRDMHAGKGRMDLLPLHAILKLSEHCEKGAIKYEEHNVDKGIPQHSLIDSGMRHLFKYAAGYTDEDHLIAAMWNIAWAVNQRETHPELIDIPWKGRNNEIQH